MTSVIERARPAAPERAVVTEADVLDRAAALLEEFGWCQRELVRSDGAGNRSFCALGAIHQADNDYYGGGDYASDDLKSLRPAGLAAFGALWESVGHIPAWNNDPRRTKAEVVAVFREAAARLREEQA